MARGQVEQAQRDGGLDAGLQKSGLPAPELFRLIKHITPDVLEEESGDDHGRVEK